ncbi:MAG: ribosome biogenesis GTPase YlqF [Candidatus Izemoplasmatales bacterium]|nr:ribosome biogenesis GTPase YlqF [Candidatus Izemoplasmatales bacterium]
MNQIQWFPGHMAKARRQVEEKLKLVDIVYELLDARIPIASANPMIQNIVKDKPRLVILNKSDLADNNETAKFIEYYENMGVPALGVNSLSGNMSTAILAKTKAILRELSEKEARKGMKPRPFRAMVLGIPNVGKSQFINHLAGKAKAKTGDTPGVTRMQTFLRGGNFLELLDNPGILWPRFDGERVGMLLAMVGTIKADLIPLEAVADFGLSLLIDKYPDRLMNRYDLEALSVDQRALFHKIGINRGCLLQGGGIDYDRVYKLFLHDLRNQLLGPMTFERITDNVSL